MARTAGRRHRLGQRQLRTVRNHNNTLIHNKLKYRVWQILTGLELGDTLADALHCPSTLVAQDDGEEPLGVTAAQGVGVCMTHTGGKDLRGR